MFFEYLYDSQYPTNTNDYATCNTPICTLMAVGCNSALNDPNNYIDVVSHNRLEGFDNIRAGYNIDACVVCTDENNNQF